MLLGAHNLQVVVFDIIKSNFTMISIQSFECCIHNVDVC
jgi:hypothetical protein